MEKTKKLNELIGELKKHKILSDDPLAKAEEIVLEKGELPKEESDVKKLERRFEFIIAENNKKIREELEFLKKSVLNLSESVNALKQLKPEIRQEVLKQPETQRSWESHPKQGKYNPEDVAVDKIFYYGNR